MSEFTVRGELGFERLEDGNVKVTYPEDVGVNSERVEVIIDAGSWASIVASVSKLGDNADTFQKAVAFHQGDLS